MDFHKLDATLTAALGSAGDERPGDDPLPVFLELHGATSPSDRKRLSRLGVALPQAGSGPITATVTARQVAALSDDPLVKYIRLSRPLRLLDDR